MSGNIYIPKPCHENWNNMTSAEKGRHCAVCSKVVTDFTNMQTEEVINTLQTSKEEVCGHIKIDQLTPTNKKQKFYFWFKGTLIPKIGYTAFAIFGLAAIFKRSAYAQSIDGQIMANGGMKYQPQEREQKQINIEVVDEANKPVDNALVTVTAGNTTIGSSYTNKTGTIMNVIEMQEVGYTFINIEVSAPGYRVKLIKDVRIQKNGQTIKVKMDEEVLLMGKMMVYQEPSTQFPIVDTSRTDRPVKMQEPEIELINTSNLILINPFPNELVEPNDLINVNEFSWNTSNVTTAAFISFPNPTNGDVTIETKQDANFDVKVYNELGVLIMQETNQYKRCNISLAGNAAGTYFAILFIDNKAIETHKIILIK